MYCNMINSEKDQTRSADYGWSAHTWGLKLGKPCRIYMLHVYAAWYLPCTPQCINTVCIHGRYQDWSQSIYSRWYLISKYLTHIDHNMHGLLPNFQVPHIHRSCTIIQSISKMIKQDLMIMRDLCICGGSNLVNHAAYTCCMYTQHSFYLAPPHVYMLHVYAADIEIDHDLYTACGTLSRNNCHI
jgi:hypothetical protein